VAGPGRWVQPVTLEGRFVRLEPLGPQHAASLAELGLEPEVWRWMPAPVTTPAEMGAFVEAALVEADAGRMVPFATVGRAR